jgi:hypothetical protein
MKTSPETGNEVWLDVLYDTHPDETMSAKLAYLHDVWPLPARFRQAHPEAAANGVRFLGRTQIMRRYGMARNHRDPEIRAARANMRWLGDRAGDPGVVVADVHNNGLKGNEYNAVGNTTTKAAAALGYLLGSTRCVVAPSRFAEAVPNGLCLERYSKPQVDTIVAAGLYAAMTAVTREHTPQSLAAYYDELVRDGEIQFYRKEEILLYDETGRRKTDLWEVLPKLESMPGGAPFTPIDPEARDLLGLPPDSLYGYWMYENNSPTLHELGADFSDGYHTAARVERRLAFGSRLVPIEPMVADGAWLHTAGGQ